MNRQKIGEATLLLAISSLVVNGLQVIKLILVSAYFGATSGRLDEYFAGVNVLLTFHGILVGSLQAAFTPRYVELVAAGEDKKADGLLRATFTFSTVIYATVAVLLAVFAAPMMKLAAVGLPDDSLALQVRLFRLSLLMFLLNGAGETLMAFYVANKRYLLTACGPILSVVLSIVYLVLFPEQGPFALVYGFIVGAFAQLVLLVAGAGRSGNFRIGWTRAFLRREYLAIFALMAPVAASLLISHGNILIDQTVASTLQSGAITVLNYATRMHDVLMKLFVVSLNSVVLPFLALYVAERKIEELRSTMGLATRMLLLVLVPVAVLVFLFGSEMVSAVFQRKQFDQDDSLAVGRVWAAYSLSLFFSAWGILAARCLIAFKDLQPLWKISLVTVPLNIVLDIFLARVLGWGVVGIAVGTACNYLATALLCRARLRYLYRREGLDEKAGASQFSPVWRTLVGLGGFGLTAWLLRMLFDPLVRVVPDPTNSHRITAVAFAMLTTAGAGLVYAAILKVLRVHEADSLYIFARRVVHPRWQAVARFFPFPRQNPGAAGSPD